jgi:hypothetical protein
MYITDEELQELKLYGIANSLADAVMNMAMLPRASFWNDESRPCNILARLHSFLSTFHGGENKEVVDVLYKEMSEAQYRADRAMPSTTHAPMESRHLIETTPSENQPVEEEPLLPGQIRSLQYQIGARARSCILQFSTLARIGSCKEILLRWSNPITRLICKPVFLRNHVSLQRIMAILHLATIRSLPDVCSHTKIARYDE